MENPWIDIFMAITQQAELMAKCYECNDVKAVKAIIFLEGDWSFLCEECFEKNYLIRLADNTGFDMRTMEAVINDRDKYTSDKL